MKRTNRKFVVLFAFIPIVIVFAQDFTPSVFDRPSVPIPMNTEDPSYDLWSQVRDASADPDREPGPFYPGSRSGALTFFNLPMAANTSSLAGFIFVGFMIARVGKNDGGAVSVNSEFVFRALSLYFVVGDLVVRNRVVGRVGVGRLKPMNLFPLES